MMPWILKREVSTRIPTRFGTFQLMLFTSNTDDKQHLALVKGKVAEGENILVRIHSECFTGDVLGSRRCDCGEQLEQAMRMIGRAQCGAILYLRQEGRGIGLLDKLRAYNLQDEGLDTVEANLRLGHQADERDYTVAALMIRNLGIRSINLITNNPQKIRQMNELGVPVNRRTPIEIRPHPENINYLLTKVRRMNHMLKLGGRLQFSE